MIKLWGEKMNKRKDECLFCTSRTCYTKIIAKNYQEIACSKHISDLEKHSDEKLGRKNGVKRIHQTSIEKLKRGENWVDVNANFENGIENIEAMNNKTLEVDDEDS